MTTRTEEHCPSTRDAAAQYIQAAAGRVKARRQNIFHTGVISGLTAGGVSALALAAMSRMQGGTAWQPFNATSHWLHGPEAGDVREADAAHTLTGAATHQAASLFWGTLFGLWAGTRETQGPAQMLGAAAGVATIAAVTDYGLMPKRLTPGWELALPRSGVALGFAAMAAGFALGGLVSRR